MSNSLTLKCVIITKRLMLLCIIIIERALEHRSQLALQKEHNL